MLIVEILIESQQEVESTKNNKAATACWELQTWLYLCLTAFVKGNNKNKSC